MLVRAALAALRQIVSAPLRRLFWRSLGWTALLLAVAWYALTAGVAALLRAFPMIQDHPWLDTILRIVTGIGFVVGLVYLLPVASALVIGWFSDEAAALVEAADYPADPPGRALPAPVALGYGLRFAGLTLAVNLVALALLLVPGINVAAFFAANAYLFGRGTFELAAARFRPVRDATELWSRNRPVILAAGALMAALLLVPVVNLVTPLFGIALMVHLNKAIAARESGRDPVRGR